MQGSSSNPPLACDVIEGTLSPDPAPVPDKKANPPPRNGSPASDPSSTSAATAPGPTSHTVAPAASHTATVNLSPDFKEANQLKPGSKTSRVTKPIDQTALEALVEKRLELRYS